MCIHLIFLCTCIVFISYSLILSPSCAVVMKSANLNFLEPSGPLQACNGFVLPFTQKFQKVNSFPISYVYWTVHGLDSWIKRDQLDVTCFFISLFNAQHVLGVNTSILRSLRLICGVISCVVLLLYDVCWCYGVVWLGWCGIRMQAEAAASDCVRLPHRNTNTHRTRAIQHMK